MNNDTAQSVAEVEQEDAQHDEELDNLRDEIAAEILQELAGIADPLSCLTKLAVDIQPPISVITLAAQAAAEVFISFERGYRMNHAKANHEI
jgi:chemotaxis protein CheY-P-specific phosphatase CheC